MYGIPKKHLCRECFIEQGLLSADFGPLIGKAQQASVATDSEAAFDADAEEVGRLLAAVRELYQNMGPSLRLPPTP